MALPGLYHIEQALVDGGRIRSHHECRSCTTGPTVKGVSCLDVVLYCLLAVGWKVEVNHLVVSRVLCEVAFSLAIEYKGLDQIRIACFVCPADPAV